MLFLKNVGITEKQMQDLLQSMPIVQKGLPREVLGYCSWSINKDIGPLHLEKHVRPVDADGYGVGYAHICGRGFHLLRFCSSDEQTLMGAHMHIQGDTLWKLRASGHATIPEEHAAGGKDEACRICRFTDRSGKRAVSVLVSNADVVPSYVRGMPISLQVAAFPREIHYYSDMYPCRMALRKSHVGSRLYLKKGAPFSVSEASPVSLLMAQVQSVQPVSLQIPEIIHFLRIRVHTCFGKLDIIHTLDMVEEKERPLIRKGAILLMNGVISGNPVGNRYAISFPVRPEGWCCAIEDAVIFRRMERLERIWGNRLGPVTVDGVHGEYMGGGGPLKEYFERLMRCNEIETERFILQKNEPNDREGIGGMIQRFRDRKIVKAYGIFDTTLPGIRIKEDSKTERFLLIRKDMDNYVGIQNITIAFDENEVKRFGKVIKTFAVQKRGDTLIRNRG